MTDTGAGCAPARFRCLAPLLLATLALALSLPRLETPARYVFDELYYAYTAGRYVAGDPGAFDTSIPPRADPAIEWTHPPLGKLVVAGGILAAGDRPLGWRLPAALLGAAGVALVCLLGRDLTGNPAAGALAGGLLLMDGTWFVESRLGTANLLYAVLTTGALFAFARALAAPPPATRPLLATGLLLGLALATKWSAAALLALVGLAVAWRAAALWRAGHRSDAAGVFRAAVIALLLLPALVYLASWAHFFATGHGPAQLIELHRAMLAYHAGVGITRSDASPWWAWPLGAGPVRYFTGGRRLGGAMVVASGNPLLSLPMVPAVAWVAIDWWGRRPRSLLVLAIGFFGQWLPWALSPRGTFVYHFLPAIPFGCVALAAIVVGLWQGGGWRRWAAGAYVAAVVAVFVYLYPIHAALPLPPDQVAPRLWLAGWR